MWYPHYFSLVTFFAIQEHEQEKIAIKVVCSRKKLFGTILFMTFHIQSTWTFNNDVFFSLFLVVSA